MIFFSCPIDQPDGRIEPLQNLLELLSGLMFFLAVTLNYLRLKRLIHIAIFGLMLLSLFNSCRAVRL